MMEGIACVFTALFGIGWIITAVSIGAPIMFPLFGIGFVLLSVIKAIFSFKNAFSQNRMSDFDIVDKEKEPENFFLRLFLLFNKTNRRCGYSKSLTREAEFFLGCRLYRYKGNI